MFVVSEIPISYRERGMEGAYHKAVCHKGVSHLLKGGESGRVREVPIYYTERGMECDYNKEEDNLLQREGMESVK